MLFSFPFPFPFIGPFPFSLVLTHERLFAWDLLLTPLDFECALGSTNIAPLCGQFSNTNDNTRYSLFASGRLETESDVQLNVFLLFPPFLSHQHQPPLQQIQGERVHCFSVELLHGLTVLLHFVRNCFCGVLSPLIAHQLMSHVQRCHFVTMDMLFLICSELLGKHFRSSTDTSQLLDRSN